MIITCGGCAGKIYIRYYPDQTETITVTCPACRHVDRVTIQPPLLSEVTELHRPRPSHTPTRENKKQGRYDDLQEVYDSETSEAISERPFDDDIAIRVEHRYYYGRRERNVSPVNQPKKSRMTYWIERKDNDTLMSRLGETSYNNYMDII